MRTTHQLTCTRGYNVVNCFGSNYTHNNNNTLDSSKGCYHFKVIPVYKR